MLDFEGMLAELIPDAGSFENIPWETMYGETLTLGVMTDEYVDNCIQYHKGMLEMAEVTLHMSHVIDCCKFIIYIQEMNKKRLNIH